MRADGQGQAGRSVPNLRYNKRRSDACPAATDGKLPKSSTCRYTLDGCWNLRAAPSYFPTATQQSVFCTDRNDMLVELSAAAGTALASLVLMGVQDELGHRWMLSFVTATPVLGSARGIEMNWESIFQPVPVPVEPILSPQERGWLTRVQHQRPASNPKMKRPAARASP